MATKKTSSKKSSTTRTSKSAPKTVVKKATKHATKRVSNKSKAASKTLAVAAPHQAFWVCDGGILHSLQELSAAFSVMSKETFSHHVSKGKNDFAVWVEEVLNDKTTANALLKAKTAKTAKAVVDKIVKIPR